MILGNPPYGLAGGADLQEFFPELAGEIDLYACFLLRSIRSVAPGGTVALLVPDTWPTNSRSRFLRGFLAGQGLSRVVDFGKPFASAKDTRVHAVFSRSGALRCEVESTRGGALVAMETVTRDQLQQEQEGGWHLYRTAGEASACRKLEEAPPLARTYEVIYGFKTGNNDAHVAAGPGGFPLIAGRDLDAYDRRVTPRHLLSPALFGTRTSTASSAAGSSGFSGSERTARSPRAGGLRQRL